MRAFKRAFGRRAARRGDAPPPDPFPSRPVRRHLRLPGLVGAMSFPSRRGAGRAAPPAAGVPAVGRLAAEDSVASNDMGNSALSLPVPDLSSVGETPAMPAPIFYDMYDVGEGARDGAGDGGDLAEAGGKPDADTDARAHDRDRHALELDDHNTVHLDIATPPTRLRPSHRRLVSERYYRSNLPQARPARKRLATPQARSLRRQYQETARTAEHRLNPDSSYEPRHRHRDPDRDRDPYRDFEKHHRDLQYYTEDDSSRITHDEGHLHTGDTNTEEPQQSIHDVKMKRFTSHADSLPRRKHHRNHSNRAPTRYRNIEESPYISQSSHQSSLSAATGRAEPHAYSAYTEIVHKEARGDSGGLRTIVELLRDSEGNPIVIEKAALVIGILSEKDAATRDAFGQFAAIQTLIQCLSMRISAKFDRTLIVKTVTYALASLLRDSPKNLRLFEMFDGPYKMGKAAASERYENFPEIPRNALRALSELKYHPHSSEGATNHVLTNSSTTSRTIMYVLRSMALHEYRTEIQERGLDALRTLLARSGRGAVESILLQQSAQATATAFKMHQESHEIQWQCLTLLCDLDGLREDMFSLKLDMECFFGALQLLISDMKSKSKRKPATASALNGLLKRAVGVAGKVGWRSRAFMEEAVDAGGVETMLDALEYFGDDVQLSDKICSILRVLLQSDEGRFRMTQVQSACAILEGIVASNERGGAVTLSS